MFKSLAAAAAALLVATTAAASPSPAPKAGKPGAETPKETLYCIAYENSVGSRISQSACKTRKQWARERVNVDELLKA